ncbi:hypothetical protein AURDEDRAFT_168433 [Auricularia subglabra TFB-10046 SS5]|nr:hypothetical protein AURDEDRAFT_168433 [Auricularia subglabra TFB-10046 SS5]
MGRRHKYSSPEEARAAQREQWRSYYARNAERLRVQAKERIAKARAQAKIKAPRDPKRELLPATWKLTQGSMAVDARTPLSALYDALTADIGRWRTRATDEAEWRSLTDRALRTAASNTGMDGLDKAFTLTSQRAAAAVTIARAAEDEAMRRSPSNAVVAARTQFAQLARYATVIDNGLGELLVCARAGHEMLKRCFDEKSLIWQTAL